MWGQSSLSTATAVVPPAPLVTLDMMYDCVKIMKSEKTSGLIGVVGKTLQWKVKCFGDSCSVYVEVYQGCP